MASPTNAFTRYVLPVALFAAIIGGVTWVANNHGAWRGHDVTPPLPAPEVQDYLKFSRHGGQSGRVVRGVFDVDPANDYGDTGYMLEMEQGKHGEYFFPFRNALSSPIDFNIEMSACDCTSAQICVVPESEWQRIDQELFKKPWSKPTFAKEPAWQVCDVKTRETGHRTIPANACCILRVDWDARKNAGDLLNLNLQFWSQPSDHSGPRQITQVAIPVIVVPPVMFDPPRIGSVRLGPGDHWQGQIYCMSDTRSPEELKVAFQPDKDDSLMEVEARLLSPAETEVLQEEMRSKTKHMLKLRTAYVLTVRLHETKGKAQMDQGPFSRTVNVLVDEIHFENIQPTINGTVKGPVEVGGEDDFGKIDFKTFSTSDAKTVTVAVYADSDKELKTEMVYPGDVFKVDFTKQTKDPKAARARWDLKVTIPAEAWRGGPLPSDARVELSVVGTGRKVRIPVIGVGTRRKG
jgi:hypothetical protein